MTSFGIYGLLAVSRVLFQILVSGLERAKVYSRKKHPMATLIVPVFNESVELLEPAFESFAKQQYKPLEIIVVDDGSDNAKEVEELAKRHNFQYIYQENAGKREAMYTAFQHMSKDSEIVFTADSDTIWDKHAAQYLADVLLDNPKTGAVTGEVAVLNKKDNLLTRLIDIRYHIAFAHERASQSFFGNVTCISGPLGAYRRDVGLQLRLRSLYAARGA